MSTPPPPPPPYGGDPNHPSSGPVGGFPPAPPGYAAYGQPGTGGAFSQQKNSGLAIAALVLSLVGIIPCFWVFQLPGLLGVIFGLVSRSQIKNSNGAKKGAGLALAGMIIGAILVVIAVIVGIYFFKNCTRDGSTWVCNSNN